MTVIDYESGYEEEPRVYRTQINDLAFIVSQMTSGIKGALPEQDDFEIAEVAAKNIQDMIDDYYET